MRVRTIKENIYQFSELSEKAQENAIERIGQTLAEDFDSDHLTDMFKERLAEWGFPTDKIEWSLGYCQGDGVAFYGSIDLVRYARHKKILTRFRKLSRNPNIYLQATIVRNSFGNHYSHYNTMDVILEVANASQLGLKPHQEKLADELEQMLIEDVRVVSKELEKLGYAEIEYQQSRARIEELIEIFEWEFHEDGRIA